MVLKAFGVGDNGFIPFAQLDAYEGKCDYFLFDRKTILHGGSGMKFNWRRLADYRGDTPFLLSGGISPEDLANKSFVHPVLRVSTSTVALRLHRIEEQRSY